MPKNWMRSLEISNPVQVVLCPKIASGNVMSDNPTGLTLSQAFLKRSMDVMGSILGLTLTSWIILPAFLAASIDTRSNGFFRQERVGRHGKVFKVIKLRTMRSVQGLDTTVTTGKDQRITALGKFWRKTKIDELPQLINILLGQMSFVGPRPDVPGFADKLQGDDRIVVGVRPGITGPATLKYRDEETLLASINDPERYNREVIWPDKVRLNKEYIQNWSFYQDLKYIWKTVVG